MPDSIPNYDSEFSLEELHLALLQAAPEGMCFLDLRGAVRFWNLVADKITGFSPAEAVCARKLSEVFFLSGPNGQPIPTVIDIDDGTIAYLRHKDGHFFPVSVWRFPVRTQGAVPMGTLVRFSVINGMPTANSSNGMAAAPLESGRMPASYAHKAEETARQAGLLVIQIDGFDVLEQRLGPEAAEKLFSLVERTTTHCLNTGETCRPLAGGRVLAFIQAGGRLASLAQKLRGLIQSARLQWWGESIAITVSIGATLINPDESPADAILRAEVCLVRSSMSGGDQVILADD